MPRRAGVVKVDDGAPRARRRAAGRRAATLGGMAFQNLIDDGAAPIRTITVNRPKVMNALDARTLEELGEAFRDIEGSPAVRVVIVTGAGDKAFVAGADIAAMAPMDEREAHRFSGLGHRVADVMEGLHAPVIAAVNGFALGGGLELALCCDFIVAASTAKLGQPEVNVGVIPGFGGTQRLARRIGIARARELLYTGALLGAEQAREWGLVNAVTAPDALHAHVRTLAETIAGRAPLAVAYAKRALRAGEDLPLPRALAYEQELFAASFGTEDQKEGMQAFLEKRAPRWKGR
jgi:enoyl-CoA hydratase